VTSITETTRLDESKSIRKGVNVMDKKRAEKLERELEVLRVCIRIAEDQYFELRKQRASGPLATKSMVELMAYDEAMEAAYERLTDLYSRTKKLKKRVN
jgi:hypothetical protein